MSIRFPLSLTRRGPGWYLTDDTGRTVATMTADKEDAEFVLHACNRYGDRPDASEEKPRGNRPETLGGTG